MTEWCVWKFRFDDLNDEEASTGCKLCFFSVVINRSNSESRVSPCMQWQHSRLILCAQLVRNVNVLVSNNSQEFIKPFGWFTKLTHNSIGWCSELSLSVYIIKIKGWKLRNNSRFLTNYFMWHYLGYFFVCKSSVTNYLFNSQSTNLSSIQMSSTTLQNGDPIKIIINLSIPTTAPKIHQILYLSHESASCCPCIPALRARLHRIKLSLSIFIITTELSRLVPYLTSEKQSHKTRSLVTLWHFPTNWEFLTLKNNSLLFEFHQHKS